MKQAFSTQLALYLFMAAGFFLLSCLSKAPGQQLVLTDTISGPYQGRLYQLPDATINALKIWATQCDEPGFLSEVMLRRNGVEQSPDCSEEESRPTGSSFAADSYKQEQLKVYPNPTNDILNIGYPVSGMPRLLQVFDFHGRLVLVIEIPTRSSQMTISSNQFSEGLYFVKLCGRNTGSIKFIVSH